MTSRIALSKIKNVKSRSFETHCYTAVLHFDGKAIANVSNSGTGGPDNISPLPGCAALLKECEAWAKTLPPEVTENFTLPMDLEFAVSIMASDLINAKELKAEFLRIRNKAGFIRDGKIFTLPVSLKTLSGESYAMTTGQLRCKFPGVEFFFDMEESAGVEKFREIMK